MFRENVLEYLLRGTHDVQEQIFYHIFKSRGFK